MRLLSGLPCRLLALALVHVGGGEFWGRTTGANALFCLTAADTMLAGEKEKMPEELLQLEGRLVDDAIVGLDGTTEGKRERRAGEGVLGRGVIGVCQGRRTGRDDNGRKGVRERAEGRGQADGTNRRGLVNG